MTTQIAPAIATGEATGESILVHIGQGYHDLTAAFERYMGMSRARWSILSRLSREETLTQAALAQLLHVDAAAITRQVKQLEGEGLITRWSSPEDNRYTVVALTAQGREFVAVKRSVRDEFERIVTTGLTAEEIDNTRLCLQHLRSNLGLLPIK
nr:winged helix-turn-helix DNA-binding protein [uncultured bacterium]